MYDLRNFLLSVVGIPEEEVSSREVYCCENDTKRTFLTNEMQGTLAGYSYTLVCAGWIKIIYNDRELTLLSGDMFIYTPGFQVSILGGSDDYRSLCLISDEWTTLEMPIVRNLVHLAYHPTAALGQPVVHLSEQQAKHFQQRMKEIIRYQKLSHRFKEESIRMLYSLFLLDLMDVMERSTGYSFHSERATELFIAFMRLLPKHFIEHHEIEFYASRLFVTTTHLSRVVRQISGRTVSDYINQMLVMEAVWLLRSTNLSIAVISERLHFADQSSFSRFFVRMKGVRPKEFRMRKYGDKTADQSK